MRAPCVPPELTTWTMSDGYVLRGRIWRAAGAPRGAVLYLHGIQSHGGWFEWSAAVLARAGYVVVLPDRRGSGLNAEARGDTPSAERWLEDVEELATWIGREAGAGPPAVVGVSWGGKLAAAWALRGPGAAARLLLIAPGIFPAVDVGLWGRCRIGAALLTRPTRMFPIPLNDPALFTDNPAGREFIASDPLKLTTATARFLYESSRLDRRLARTPKAGLQVPVTLVLAGRDRIIRNGRTVGWLRRVARRTPEVAELAGSAHTLEFEADGRAFQHLLEQWGAAVVVAGG